MVRHSAGCHLTGIRHVARISSRGGAAPQKGPLPSDKRAPSRALKGPHSRAFKGRYRTKNCVFYNNEDAVTCRNLQQTRSQDCVPGWCLKCFFSDLKSDLFKTYCAAERRENFECNALDMLYAFSSNQAFATFKMLFY